MKKIFEIPVGSGGGSKHGDKSFDRILGIGIPYLLMNLMSFHGFLRNINSVVILKPLKGCRNTILQKDLLFWNEMIIIWKNFQMK